MHPLRRRVEAEALRGCPLDAVARALGYRQDPDEAARWRRPGSVVTINRFMFYDHLTATAGAGAVDLVIHVLGCSRRDALDILATLSHRPPRPGCRRHDPRWPALHRHLVGRCGLADILVDLCRALDLIHADPSGNPVFVTRNAGGEAVGIEIPGPMTEPATAGGFWMSWEPEWPVRVILATSALDVLSILSLHCIPAQRECAVVSTGVIAAVPAWVETWNPRRIFCAWEATPNGDDAARHMIESDTRIVRMRPALDGACWNDMLIRSRAGEPVCTDDQPAV